MNKRHDELLVLLGGILFVCIGLLIPTQIIHLKSVGLQMLYTILAISLGLLMIIYHKHK